ncbi:Putative 115 kDa protein in type-1 retrotransposable element R1DM [Eumeta japonica]|uniref:115 kDa protein in type-1 retrotransposable element R1DM n=1 Tax=Eumeta variegata TaxID=151549 RepID=A0A4C1UFG1_EUMVA|nr:Putative 115 kDa protein in type-1 retrotransposable element R1DM [Eumeta japonica]
MVKRQLAQSEIQRALVESDDENISVRECDSDDENFAVDSCSDSESNVTEPASENDDEQLWSESDDVPIEEYVSIDTYEGRDGTTWKSELDRQSRTPRHNIIRGGIHKSFTKSMEINRQNRNASISWSLLTIGVNEQRSLRKSKDKLAPIRELWEYVNQNLKKFYLPGENLTIDEQLVPFRGRVSFKQYLPSKPDKHETAGNEAKYSHENKGVRGVEDVPNDGTIAAGSPPAKLVVEVKPADASATAARESDVEVFTALEAVGDFARRASFKDEIGRPSLPASGRPTPVDLSGGTPRPERRDSRSVRLDAHPIGRLASSIETLAMEARGELEGLKNISRDVKESVIGKLAAISELALRHEEYRSSYIMELERERTRRAREAEAAEKRIAKIAKENLDRILQIETKIDKMAGEVSSTRNLLGHFDVPKKLEAIQKTLEAGIAPHALNYAEVAAKPKPLAAAPKRIPGSEIRTGAGHTLIISSRIENHTAEQVVTKLRSVIDAREMGVTVDRLRKTRNQKVVVSCSSAEDAKKIKERLKMRGADLRVSKPKKRLPTVVIRGVLKGRGRQPTGIATTPARLLAQDRESIWDGIYRVIRNTRRNREDVLLINDSGQTCSPNESAVLLANTFFPDDRIDTDDPYHTELRRRTDGSVRPPEAPDILSGMDPPFTGAEVKMALKAFNPKKAPRIDGFTSDICQTAILRDLGLFLAMANKCLQLGYFPRAWKVATIKVIPKPGKDDYSRPKSYRPIGLLPLMGKTVERMLVWRIQWHIMPKLQMRQYGFMPQRGTEDSLYDLMTHIHNELNLKRIIVVVSLDIEGAFDNAWWPAIRNQLLVHKCPVNLYGMVMGYLRDREVVVRYAGGESRRMTPKGCIQGSIAGPTFWNLVLDSLLRELGDLGVYVQAFADDVDLMFSGQSASALEAETNRALAHVRDWSDRNKLRFAPSKTNAMVLTKKLKFDVPVIRMGNTEISLVDEIRLLGLTIDKGLTFTPHVAKACKRAANIYKGIARAAKATWGLSPEIVRTIYVAAIEPIVMYASCAWAPATKKLGVRKMLDALKRSVALKACRDYRTVSLHSALILAFEGVEDLDPSTMDRLAIVGPHIYTDGSRIEGKVDAALAEWRDGIESGNFAYRLESFCTVFQAEMFALHRAIRRVKKGKDRLVRSRRPRLRCRPPTRADVFLDSDAIYVHFHRRSVSKKEIVQCCVVHAHLRVIALVGYCCAVSATSPVVGGRWLSTSPFVDRRGVLRDS